MLNRITLKRFKIDIPLNLQVIILFLVIITAFVLRVLLLDQIPAGLNSDEASTGYDAFSLLKTGRDQFGQFLPLFPRSFGDYNEGLYRYLCLPFVAVFGLHEWTIRLPAALIGAFTVLVLFLFVKHVAGYKEALISSLLLAFSPWHLQFSRTGLRAIVLPFALILALYFFNKFKDNPKNLLLSSFLFVLSLYTYSSARVFIPLLLLVIFALNRKELISIKQYTVPAGIIFSLGFLLLFSFWITPEGMARARATLQLDLLASVKNYFSYFSPEFLFISGDGNLRCSPAGTGQLYLFELLTVPFGLFTVLRTPRIKFHQLLIAWLLLYPLPAALTMPGHSLRVIAGVPLFAILSAKGVVFLHQWFRSPKSRRIFLSAATAIFLLSVSHYLKYYYTKYPSHSAQAWEFGIGPAIQYAQASDYTCVCFGKSIDYPEVFTLFYTRYPPRDYQARLEDQRNLFLGKFYFGSLSKQIGSFKKILLITRPADVLVIPEMKDLGFVGRIIHTIPYPDGTEAFRLIEIDTSRRLTPP